MFPAKRRVTATLLIVGFLAVSFGMYAVFQVHDAAADGTHAKITGKIRYFTKTTTTWTFYSYNGPPCPSGSASSTKVEEEWTTDTRYKQVRVYYHHEDGRVHWRNVSTRAVSTSTKRRNNYRYVCPVHGLSCVGLNGG